jgi:hypothetical protein
VDNHVDNCVDNTYFSTHSQLTPVRRRKKLDKNKDFNKDFPGFLREKNINLLILHRKRKMWITILTTCKAKNLQ